MNIVLLGPYGAGKGTQAARLVAKFGLLHISIGDLFRDHIKNQTGLGLLIQEYLDQGSLVPDEVAEATLEEWLRVTDPYCGILFDGFPRTLPQVKFLDELLLETGRSLNTVIYLKVSDDEVVKRLSERWVCQTCFTGFHKILNPFKTCPYNQCQGERLVQREEDRPETVRTRLQVFHQETEPLFEHFKETEKLVIIDGEKPIDQVFKSIIQTLQLRSSSNGH